MVAAVGALAVLVAVSLGGGNSPDTGPVAGAPNGTATPAPEPEAPPPDVTEASLAAEVADLSRYVSARRGLPFQDPVDVSLVDPEVFAAAADARAGERAPAWELLGRIWAPLGLSPGPDGTAEAVDAIDAQAVARYDPATGTLEVARRPLDLWLRRTLVAELTRALNDQWLDLDRPTFTAEPGEGTFGFSAAVEGDADRVANAWVADLTLAERQQLAALETRRNLEAAGIDLPWPIAALLAAQANEGRTLIDQVLVLGGEEAVDGLIEAPPTSSAAVLWPERHTAGLPVANVATPPVGGAPDAPPSDTPVPAEGDPRVFATGTFGALPLRIGLAGVLDPDGADRAAQSWRGDAFVAWAESPELDCVRIDTETASAEARDRLASALALWAAALPTAEVDEVSATGVRLTACASPTENLTGESVL